MKKTPFIVTILVLVALVIWGAAYLIKPRLVIESGEVTEVKQSAQLCYYGSEQTSSSFRDVSWVHLDLAGDQVTGEVRTLPAEKDSKVGTITGTVSSLDPSIMGRLATVIWSTYAEGAEIPEELLVQFGDGGAALAFGEMKDRGDGTYVYANKSNLMYGPTMSQVSCEDLNERIHHNPTAWIARSRQRTVASTGLSRHQYRSPEPDLQ